MTSTETVPQEGRRQAPPLLRALGLIKDFPGLRALDEVSLDVDGGEIVALVGHNGSGKSTLVKILAGVYTPDGGRVELGGDESERTELHVIHQDLGLVSELTAVENLGLAAHPGARALAPLQRRRESRRARDLLSRFGDAFDVDVPISTLAPAQRSIIAIARAMDGWTHDANVLILDEPTEALHASEVDVLFDAVRRVAAAGAGVVFISHRLDEVLTLSDRVVVLRDGRKVADQRTADLDQQSLVRHVTGVDADRSDSHRTRVQADGETLLDVAGLRSAGISGVDLRLREGEILGIAGVLGSGRDALPAALFGAVGSVAERFAVGGRDYPMRSPRESVRRGMAFVAGDRIALGAIGPMNARENMTLPELKDVTGPIGVLRSQRERAHARTLVERYDVRPARAEQRFTQFSGGNQQKIVFAKWLRNDPRILLLEEPTQGVDIGAKQAIYDEIERAAADGAGVIVCSSDAKELVRLCDRVLVMRAGDVVAELAGDELTEPALVARGYGLATASTIGQEGPHHDH